MLSEYRLLLFADGPKGSRSLGDASHAVRRCVSSTGEKGGVAGSMEMALPLPVEESDVLEVLELERLWRNEKRFLPLVSLPLLDLLLPLSEERD